MSYLLTEIALDMLGYKFYDTDGTFHNTDFQTMVYPPSSENSEPNLEKIFYSNLSDSKSKPKSKPSSDSIDSCYEVNKDELIMYNLKESIEKEVENIREEIYLNKSKFLEENLKVLKKRDKSSKITPDILKPYNEREHRNIQNEAEMLSEFLRCVEKRLEEANPEQFKEHKRYRMEEFL